MRYRLLAVGALLGLTIVLLVRSETAGQSSDRSKTFVVVQSSRGELAEDDALAGGADQSDGDSHSSPVVQSPEDALAQDLALVAAANGWTLEEAAAHDRAGDIADGVAAQLAETRPEIYVGGALSPEPGGAPMIYIKGPADDYVRRLVAAAEIEIKIIDNQPFSFEELQQRKSQVTDALQDMGFRNFAVGSSVTGGGQIKAGVTLEPGLPNDVDEILAGIPATVRESVVLTLSKTPVVSDDGR